MSTADSPLHVPTSRGKRFIKITLSLIALLSLLLIASGYYLLGTSSGLQQLINISQRWLPGELQVQQINGSLFNQLDLTRISYQQPDMTLSIDSLQLHWQPSALFSGRLHIVQLLLERPVITLIDSTDNSPNKPIDTALADIELPLQLQIDQVQINRLTVQPISNPDEPSTATEISSLQLKLRTNTQTWTLDQLKIVAPQGHLVVNGQLTPREQFPIKLTTQWSVTLANYQPLLGQGTIQGDLNGEQNGLTVQQTLTGLVNTQLSAALQNLLKQPTGQLNLKNFQTGLEQFAPVLINRHVNGSAELRGNAEQLQFNSLWQTSLPEIGASELSVKLHLAGRQVNIEQLSLRQSQPRSDQQPLAKPLALTLQGSFDFTQTPPSFNLQGQWHNLRYPFNGPAAYYSPSGQMQLNGDLQHYELLLSTTVSGTDIPSGQWTLTGSGSEQALNDITLTGQTLEGIVQLNGELAWQPHLTWHFNLSGQQLNPGSHWPAWPSKLNLQATLNGAHPAERLQLQLNLTSLNGQLRHEPMTAMAQVKINGDRIAIPKLQLQIAATKIETHGRLDETLDLSWSIRSPDLSQLLPNLQGSLTGTGNLTGSQTLPHLKATLEGQNLQFEHYRSGTFAADLDVNLNSVSRSHIQLSASQLSLAGQHWQQLDLNGQGSAEQHQLTLKTTGGPADTDLNLNGRWHNAQWRGNIVRLDITQAELGAWQILQPVALQLSSQAAALAPLCLQSSLTPDSSLCLNANWSTELGLTGALTTEQLSLNHLQPWIPNQANLQGTLKTDIHIAQAPNKTPIFNGSARISDAELRLEEKDLDIIAKDIILDLKGQNNQLDVTLSLPLQQPIGQLQARLKVNDFNTHQTLDADLDLALSDLKFISLFAPQLQAITGQLNADMSITGSIDQPQLQGHLILNDAATDLPALGIKLEDINLSVIGESGNNNLQLKGALQSGQGPIEIRGQYNPVTDNGNISLQGDHFKALATEEVQAWISPKIQFNITPQQMTLRGELTIPEAHITPPKIDAISPLSEDVIIINSTADNQSQARSKRRLDAQVRITLGDKVYLDALGFGGRLLGSILVEDNGHQATRATGIIQVASGQYRLYGQDLDIERGSLIYSGGPIDNPGLDLRVSRTIEEVTAGAKISGTLNDPQLSLFSNPALPESSQLSYLMFGHAPNTGGNALTEQELLFKAASALTLKGGNTIAEQISETFNIDDLGLTGGETATDTSLYIGKYLSPRLYVKYGVGLLEPTHTFFMRYKLNESWSVETQTANEYNGGDLFYMLER